MRPLKGELIMSRSFAGKKKQAQSYSLKLFLFLSSRTPACIGAHYICSMCAYTQREGLSHIAYRGEKVDTLLRDEEYIAPPAEKLSPRRREAPYAGTLRDPA